MKTLILSLFTLSRIIMCNGIANNANQGLKTTADPNKMVNKLCKNDPSFCLTYAHRMVVQASGGDYVRQKRHPAMQKMKEAQRAKRNSVDAPTTNKWQVEEKIRYSEKTKRFEKFMSLKFVKLRRKSLVS